MLIAISASGHSQALCTFATYSVPRDRREYFG